MITRNNSIHTHVEEDLFFACTCISAITKNLKLNNDYSPLNLNINYACIVYCLSQNYLSTISALNKILKLKMRNVVVKIDFKLQSYFYIFAPLKQNGNIKFAGVAQLVRAQDS